MTHILLDIKYNNTESVLYDRNRGEAIIKNWCEYNNHTLVMPPISHVFPTYNDKNKEKMIEGFFQSSLSPYHCDYGGACADGSESDHRSLHQQEEPGSQDPQGGYNGYTSIGLLKESHISIHTYPEANSIQIDFFSCKDLDERQNEKYMERIFQRSKTIKYDCQFIKRTVL
tara:strand:+ start:6008 stop:6520 length:513 start_codon:yes stop_codon:yes gene_type:complete